MTDEVLSLLVCANKDKNVAHRSATVQQFADIGKHVVHYALLRHATFQFLFFSLDFIPISLYLHVAGILVGLVAIVGEVERQRVAPLISLCLAIDVSKLMGISAIAAEVLKQIMVKLHHPRLAAEVFGQGVSGVHALHDAVVAVAPTVDALLHIAHDESCTAAGKHLVDKLAEHLPL